jgi:hypothetical protein
MSASPTSFRGVVRDGVIVFASPYPLPDGTEVEITVTRHIFTPEEQAEFDAWDKLSDEALALIDEWEKEDATQQRLPRAPETHA